MPTTKQQFLNQFDSPATKSTYGHAIDSFFFFTEQHLPGDVTLEDVSRWRDSLRRFAINSQYTKWVALKSYFAWLLKAGFITTNPFTLVRGPSRVQNYTPRIPTTAEVKAIRSVQPEDWRDSRDKAIVSLLANGLRIGEVCSLTWGDILIEKTVAVPMGAWDATLRVTGKGNKERIIPLSAFCRIDIEAWHSIQGKPLLGPMFSNYSDRTQAMTTRQVQAAFNRIAKSAGVVGLSPHKLRHHYATRLIRAGADVFSVQKLLGHASVSTTQVYVNLDLEDLRRAVEKDTL